MNEKFLCKAKSQKSNWIYGYYMEMFNNSYIVSPSKNGEVVYTLIEPNTVSRYTGIKYNDNCIYEGDLITYADMETPYTGLIVFKDGCACVNVLQDNMVIKTILLSAVVKVCKIKVIGNKHDKQLNDTFTDKDGTLIQNGDLVIYENKIWRVTVTDKVCIMLSAGGGEIATLTKNKAKLSKIINI